MKEGHLFMVCLTPMTSTPDQKYRWTVTCERCGQDFSDSYGDRPISIINVKGNISPMRLEEFKRALVKAVDENTGRPIVMNADVDFHTLPSANLQRVISEHVASCNKPLPKPPCQHDSHVLVDQDTAHCHDCDQLVLITCRKPECKLHALHPGPCIHDGGTR